MQGIVDKYDTSQSIYLLPIIKPSNKTDARTQYLYTAHNINRCLKKIGKHPFINIAQLTFFKRKDFNSLKLQAYVYDRMKMSAHGVAYIYINRATRKRFKLTFEQACACVGYMDSIKDSLIWIAFIESDDGSIRVRLRSRFVTVNEVAEKYNGGGHDCASGATVHSRKEMKALISDADTRLADYKESNEGWL